jgi:hypothetical protein
MSNSTACKLVDGSAARCITDGNFASTGIVFFLFAIFCAYWAQTTRRSAWLWFFFGLVLAPIAGLALLYKNATDKTGPSR